MRGIGIYLWQPGHVANGDPVAIADRAVEAGARRLYIKVSDGNGQRPLVPLLRIADACVARNIEPWAWAYVYDSQPEKAALALASRTKAIGAAGCVINAEKEFVDGDGGRDAQVLDQLFTATRHLLPAQIPIGFSSFKFPRSFPAYPWHVLRKHQVFGMPQVYLPGSNGAWGPQAARSISQYAALGMTVLPTLGSTQSGSVNGFMSAVEMTRSLAERGACLPACDVWSLDQIWDKPDWLATLHKADSRLCAELSHTGGYTCPLDDAWDYQAALGRLGLYDGPVTAVWQKAGKEAARKFQKARGLVVDGIVGPKTVAALRAALKEKGLP